MESVTESLVETQLMIDGRWQPSLSERSYEVFNPANPEELVGRAARADGRDVRLAIQAAHRAYPGWAALSCQERAGYLNRVADQLVADERDLESRIRLFTREHGKVLKEARTEMTRLGDRFRYCASLADRLAEEERLSAPPLDTLIIRQPRGVAALIVPWNWPLSILGAKLPQALISGNTAVIKLASQSPLAPALTVRIMSDVLPPGVVNLVTGSSSELGEELLKNPLVRKINFTGGSDSGRAVMKAAADGLKHVTLELGGNDAAIVLEDADLGPETLQRMVLGGFLTAGQVCMAMKRLYVHRSRYHELVEGYRTALDRQVLGDGLDPEVSMGPLNNRAQQEFVIRLVEEAREKGADVQEVGTVKHPDLFQRGYFHRPTIVTNASCDLQVVRCEQFGPVMPIMPFDSEDEAVRLANDCEFGLCSSVWTADPERALSVARRLEAGYTYVNAHGPMAQDNRAPFGGFKESGLGRNLGYEGVLEFMECHSVSAQPGFLF